MKKNLLKTGFLALAMIGVLPTLKAQVDGEYRSTETGGDWSAPETWLKYDLATTSWLPADVKPGGSSVINIVTGSTVSISDGTKSATKLRIQSGATLKTSGSSIRGFRVIDSLVNNGTFGSATVAAERLIIEGYKDNGDAVVTGDGAYYVNNIRVNTKAENLRLILDADINMSGYLIGYYSGSTTGQEDDNVEIIIKSGKTVTFTTSGSTAYLHLPSSVTANSYAAFGNYTYTINGTLDMSAAGTSCIIAHSTLTKNVTVNVNGTWKIGGAIRTASNLATLPVGTANFNIGANGVVDATAATGTNMVMTAASGLVTFFNISGNGVLKQNPFKHSSQKIFRVGTDGLYSPVNIDATTTPDVTFTVNIAANADGGKKAVNRVWDISASEPVADLTLKFGSITEVEKNGFNIADPVTVYRWDGSAWDTGVTATTSGTGVIADTHIAEIGSVNTLGKFTVANETPATLPLKFISVNAKINATGKQALITWQTADEKNTLDFVIEKSTNGINFNQIGIVGANNSSGLNNYNYTDNNVDAGTSYYRINQRDIDGKSAVSRVVSVNQKSQIAINVYPNPVINDLNISYPLNIRDGKVTIYNANGNVVITQKTNSNSTSSTVNVAQLVPAVYIVEIITDSETVVKRFVKQ